MQQKPQNLFCTKYVLSFIASFYIITLSPLIDKVINDNLTKKRYRKSNKCYFSNSVCC
jgi:hypothetical protein